MINFGYSISQSGRIDLDKADMSLAKAVLEAEPSLALCIGCGSCTGTCSANCFSADFNLRKTQLLLNRGQYESLIEQTGKCMLCGKCQMVCPRGVNTRNVIVQIHRQLLIREAKKTTTI